MSWCVFTENFSQNSEIETMTMLKKKSLDLKWMNIISSYYFGL